MLAIWQWTTHSGAQISPFATIHIDQLLVLLHTTWCDRKPSYDGTRPDQTINGRPCAEDERCSSSIWWDLYRRRRGKQCMDKTGTPWKGEKRWRATKRSLARSRGTPKPSFAQGEHTDKSPATRWLTNFGFRNYNSLVKTKLGHILSQNTLFLAISCQGISPSWSGIFKVSM